MGGQYTTMTTDDPTTGRPVMQIVMTALLSSSMTAGAIYLLWRLVLVPQLDARVAELEVKVDEIEVRARELGREMAEEATARAVVDLTTAAEALVPQFRQAVRDGIQDAVLSPPTERLSQTARGVTNAGVNVVESSIRRIFGTPQPRPPQPREP